MTGPTDADVPGLLRLVAHDPETAAVHLAAWYEESLDALGTAAGLTATARDAWLTNLLVATVTALPRLRLPAVGAATALTVWLFRQALQQLRMMRRRPAPAGPAPGWPDALCQAVPLLAPPEQAVVLLGTCAGLPIPTVALILDLPLPTVRAQQHQALRTLARLVGPPR